MTSHLAEFPHLRCCIIVQLEYKLENTNMLSIDNVDLIRTNNTLLELIAKILDERSIPAIQNSEG